MLKKVTSAPFEVYFQNTYIAWMWGNELPEIIKLINLFL